MSKKLKAIESEIQPNHKEAEIWVTPTNEDGSKEIKYWNRKKDEWSECGGGIPEQINLHIDGKINGQIGNHNIDIVDGEVYLSSGIQENVKSVQSTDNSCTIHLNGGIREIFAIMCLHTSPTCPSVDIRCDRFDWNTATWSYNSMVSVITNDNEYNQLEDIIDSSLHIFFITYNPSEHKEETLYTLELICGNDDEVLQPE